MERKLLVSLIKKNIEELDMLTEGFAEMLTYPKPIMMLARHKTADIIAYLDQLEGLHPETDANPAVITETIPDEDLPYPEIAMAAEELFVNTDEPEAEIHPNSGEDFAGVISEIKEEPRPQTPVYPDAEVPKVAEETVLVANAEPDTKPATPDNTVIDEPTLTDTEQAPANAASTRNETLTKTDLSLGEALANKKVTDIKQAMTLSDRFRFQRELFNGSGEEMNKAIVHINMLNTFEEVEAWLTAKYNWDAENPATEDFYKLIHRKF